MSLDLDEMRSTAKQRELLNGAVADLVTLLEEIPRECSQSIVVREVICILEKLSF